MVDTEKFARIHRAVSDARKDGVISGGRPDDNFGFEEEEGEQPDEMVLSDDDDYSGGVPGRPPEGPYDFSKLDLVKQLARLSNVGVSYELAHTNTEIYKNIVRSCRFACWKYHVSVPYWLPETDSIKAAAIDEFEE